MCVQMLKYCIEMGNWIIMKPVLDFSLGIPDSPGVGKKVRLYSRPPHTMVIFAMPLSDPNPYFKVTFTVNLKHVENKMPVWAQILLDINNKKPSYR